jgi:two-component system, NarL family, sensor kinase
MPNNNDIIVTILTGSVILLIMVCFVISFILLYQKKYFRHRQEMEKMSDHFSQTLLQTQLEIQEKTLNTISQEVHDNIGQVLSLAKLHLGTVDINNPSGLPEKIENSRQLIGKAIQDLRDLSRSLNTNYVTQMGLQRSVEYELDLIKKAGSHETRVEVTGEPVRLDPQKELIIFRIGQEVLNNIIKHASATVIVVRFTYTHSNFELEFVDNGKGFNLETLEEERGKNAGLGVKNMHSRAALIGALYHISSTTGKGTTVKISLPL